MISVAQHADKNDMDGNRKTLAVMTVCLLLILTSCYLGVTKKTLMTGPIPYSGNAWFMFFDAERITIGTAAESTSTYGWVDGVSVRHVSPSDTVAMRKRLNVIESHGASAFGARVFHRGYVGSAFISVTSIHVMHIFASFVVGIVIVRQSTRIRRHTNHRENTQRVSSLE